MNKVFYGGMNTNRWIVLASMLIFLSVGCFGLTAWFSGPLLSNKNSNPLTSMMSDTTLTKKKRRIRKKQSKGAVHDSNKNNSYATDEVKLSLQSATKGRLDHFVGPSSNSFPQKDVSLPDQEADDDEESVTKSTGSSGSTGAYEANLRKSLTTLLRGGMTVTLHRAGKPPKSVVLSLVGKYGSILRWRSTRLLSRQFYELNLTDVVSIEWGKNTDAFIRSPNSNLIPHDLCFSIVASISSTNISEKQQYASSNEFITTRTLDLQASSSIERDLLVQGFTLLIGDMKSDRSTEFL